MPRPTRIVRMPSANPLRKSGWLGWKVLALLGRHRRNLAFLDFLRFDTVYHGSVNTGEIIGALDRGGTAIYVILNEIVGQNLVPPLLVVSGVLSSLVMKNPWMALIVSLPLPAYVFAIN